MHLLYPLKRGALALALGLSIATAAWAGDETTIRVRTSAGATESVTVQDIGAFAVGEGRALTTAAGNYAFLRREDGKFALEVAGERFELHDFASAEAGLPGEAALHHEGAGDAKHIVIDKRVEKTTTGDADGKRHRIVRIVDGDGSEHEALAMALAGAEAGDDEAFALADGDGPRVMVTRRITKESAPAQ